jgi:hypothetical protein
MKKQYITPEIKIEFVEMEEGITKGSRKPHKDENDQGEDNNDQGKHFDIQFDL